MNDKPEAAALLAVARDAFNAEILPALPAAQRYNGLMIAAALGVVLRELEAGEAPARAELERLTALLPDEPPGRPAVEGLRVALQDYNRRLAAAIRAGRFDGSAALREHLRNTTEEKLAVSNPKMLEPSPPTPLPVGEGRQNVPFSPREKG